jgi:hypothetical protein
MLAEEFVHDVKNAEKEVHVLRPTRYERPLVRDARAEKQNWGLVYGEPVSTIRSEAWRDMHEAQMDVLRMFGRARLQG